MKETKTEKLLISYSHKRQHHSNTSIVAYRDKVQSLAFDTPQSLDKTTPSITQSITKPSQFCLQNASQSPPPSSLDLTTATVS